MNLHVINAAADYLVSQVCPGTDDVVIAVDAKENFEEFEESMLAIYKAVMRQTRVHTATVCFYNHDEIKRTRLLYRTSPDYRKAIDDLGIGYMNSGGPCYPVLKYIKSCYRNASVIVVTDGQSFRSELEGVKVGWFIASRMRLIDYYHPSAYFDDDRYLLVGNGPNLWET